MEALTLQDTQKLLESIHSLHSLKNPQTFATDALLLLEQLVPTSASCTVTYQTVGSAEIVAMLEQQAPLEAHQAITAQKVSILSENIQIHSPAADFARLLTADLFPLLEHAVLESPFVENAPLLLTGAHKFSDFATHESVCRREWLHELSLAIQSDDHLMLVFNGSEPGSGCGDRTFGYFYLYRNWNEWTERDRLILNLIQPHVNQAYRSVRHFHQLYQQLDQIQKTFDGSGAILLDGQGYIQQISAQAACWLYDYCPTAYFSRQLPEPVHTWFVNQLPQLNPQANALSPGLSSTLPLRIKQGNRQLTIRVKGDSERRQYLLLLTEEKMLSLQAALEHLGLTKREAEVLFQVAQGQDNQAIAAQLNISLSTVRKHLENIYLKLRVSSRTEAVARSLEMIGLVD